MSLQILSFMGGTYRRDQGQIFAFKTVRGSTWGEGTSGRWCITIEEL